jgi:Na+/melibiose symporter-like transporter
VPGAVLGALGIGGPVFALIEQSRLGVGHPLVIGSLVVGVVCLVLFVVRERRTPHPMLPLSLFRERDFLVGNIATVGIYGALSLGGFVIAVFLQQAGGLSATAAGFALVPTTVIMLLLSTRFGALAGRIGPRLLMGVGPIVAGGGYLLMLRVAEPVDYWGQLLPGILVFSRPRSSRPCRRRRRASRPRSTTRCRAWPGWSRSRPSASSRARNSTSRRSTASCS